MLSLYKQFNTLKAFVLPYFCVFIYSANPVACAGMEMIFG
jgi:hypothetical protein